MRDFIENLDWGFWGFIGVMVLLMASVVGAAFIADQHQRQETQRLKEQCQQSGKCIVIEVPNYNTHSITLIPNGQGGFITF